MCRRLTRARDGQIGRGVATADRWPAGGISLDSSQLFVRSTLCSNYRFELVKILLFLFIQPKQTSEIILVKMQGKCLKRVTPCRQSDHLSEFSLENSTAS